MTVFDVTSESETHEIARQLANRVRVGNVIALKGTLGAGKTTFARAFIQHLTQTVEEVPSPTFTLLQTYDTRGFTVFHFDLYRLEKPHEAYELGIEDAFSDGVCLIEWPEKLGDLMPKEHISVHIDFTASGRRITIKG